MIEPKFIERIALEVAARPEHVAKAIELFDGGATIPFVARYRKDVTGNLHEEKLEIVADRNTYFGALANRRGSILKAVEKMGKLTDELRAAIEACEDRAVLEDLYLPFKKKRPTKATVARQKGLEPLAGLLLAQNPDALDVNALAEGFVRADKAVSSVEEALEGACFIVAEDVANDAGIRALIRERMLSEGQVTARSTKNAEGKKTKFEAYYEFSEAAAKIPSHRVLAILRGVKIGVLRMDIAMDDERMFNDLLARCVTLPGSPYEPHLRSALEEAYQRHLRPAIEHEVVGILHKRADEEAIRVFRENTRNLLLAPPAGPIVVIGVEPGLRTGCKLAVVDRDGTLLEAQTIFPNDPLNDIEGSEKIAVELFQKHHVHAVVVGNGTAARETGRFFKQLLAKQGLKNVFCAFVNETSASAHGASKAAREEVPDLEVGVREALSIARRFQDPLVELVKIEPRNIGVGQYQHDVNQRQLRDSLHRTIVSCVNQVGVDLNTASLDMLRYIAGIHMGTAQNIVTKRTELGQFTSRVQLNDVDGIGAKVFEQCAGFLRISNGDNPLDATSIHPEAYPVVERMAASLGITVAELVRNRDQIEKIQYTEFHVDTIGSFTLRDIHDELLKPGRDPRSRFKVPKFLDGVYSVDDLNENMEMEGVVTNVTDFGAFVDVGVHQDGLVHLSELANRFVKDPRQVVKVGQIVRVKVIKVDKDAPRISLSMKAVAPPPKRRPQRPQPEARAPRPPEEGAPRQETPEGGQGRPPRDDRRPEDRRPPRDDQRTERPPRDDQRPSGPPRGDRRDRPDRRDRGDARPGGDRRPSRPPRQDGPRGTREFGRPGDSGGVLNTQLAEQLAALRDKLKS